MSSSMIAWHISYNKQYDNKGSDMRFITFLSLNRIGMRLSWCCFTNKMQTTQVAIYCTAKITITRHSFIRRFHLSSDLFGERKGEKCIGSPLLFFFHSSRFFKSFLHVHHEQCGHICLVNVIMTRASTAEIANHT